MRFIDNLLQQQIEEKGFVKVPLLSIEEVAEIKQYIFQNTPLVEMTKHYGFTAAVWMSERDKKVNLDLKIRSLVEPKLKELIDGFKAITYSAIGKGIGENSELGLHQDWSVVDEEKEYSLSMWIPLSNSNYENGAIHFLSGSHKTFPRIRCGSISHEYGDAQTIIKQMECIEVTAGDALLFNSRILHYTPNNYSADMRFALISCIVPSKAEIVQYYKVNDSKIEVYKMEEDFYNKYDNFLEELDKQPKGVKIGEVDYVPFMTSL